MDLIIRFSIANYIGTMLPSLKAIRAGALQRHAITASSKYTNTIPNLPCLSAMKATSYFLPIQSTPSFCTSSWSKGRSQYLCRNPGYRLRGSHLPTLRDSVGKNSFDGSAGNQNHSIYRYFSNHGWQHSHFWGRYGYGWRWSDRYSGADGRPKEDEVTDNVLWRTRRKFLARQMANIRRIRDADSFGSVLGQRFQSTYKRDEKKISTDSDIFSRKTQEAIEERFSTLKKMLDEDPYSVLFGRRLQTKSPKEDVSFCDSVSYRPSKSEGTSSVKNASDSYDSIFGFSRPHQEAASRINGQPPSQNGAAGSVSESASQNEELEFDPITMRKVPKKRSNMTATPHDLGTETSFNIPVKPFRRPISSDLNISATTPDINMQKSPQSVPLKPKPPTASSTSSEPGRGWLPREGFGNKGHKVDGSSQRSSTNASSESRKGSNNKIESALDRHVKDMNKSSGQNPANSSPLKYPIRETTEEDIDLLRASDVRASAGICKRVSKPTTAEQQERRAILSDDYESRNHQLDRRLEEELRSQKTASENAKKHAEVNDSSLKYSQDHPVAISEIKKSSLNMPIDETLPSESETLLSVPTSLSQREARKRLEARRAHEIEVNAQKVAMEAIETRDNIGPSQCNIEAIESQRAGKSGKASNIDVFASRPSPQESDQQLAKDKALIRDIQSIYEDQYGIIDVYHRQPSLGAAEISPVKTTLGKSASRQKATNEVLEQTTKSAHAESRAGDQRSPNKGDSVSSTIEQSANYGDPSCLKPQDRKVGDQIDIRRQLLREVYETQNLIRDLSRRISESKLPQSVLRESPSHPNVPEQTLQQSSNSSSIPYSGQGDSYGAEGILSDKQAKLHSASKPPLNQFDSGSPTSNGFETGESATIPVSYRILAYDPTTQRVTAAKNTFLTSPTSEKRLTVAEALSGLANPAKFLPHFASLQSAGYEIVSGSSNLLIFQKTGSEKLSASSTDEDVPEFKGRYSMHTNPIDGTTPQTGNFASPTGFVNYDSVLPTPDATEGTTWQNNPRTPKKSDKARREEAVFSRRGWRDSHNEKVGKWVKFRGHQRRRRGWRRAKRMLWVGSCVAGCCYVAAVASEVFRGRASRKPPGLTDRVNR